MEKKFLLFRAFQHGEEGKQSTTVYPRAPFQHLHVGYHVTLWCILALGHPTASVWSWLSSQRKVKEKPPKKSQQEAGSSTGISPSKPLTLDTWLVGLPVPSHNYRESQKDFFLISRCVWQAITKIIFQLVRASPHKKISILWGWENLNVKLSHNIKAMLSVKVISSLVGGI